MLREGLLWLPPELDLGKERREWIGRVWWWPEGAEKVVGLEGYRS
jgi:hypothetical protein